MTLRTIGAAVAKTSIGLVVLALLIELALRPFGYGSHTIYEPDERLLWVPIAAQDSLSVINHEPLTISADRFRYGSPLSAKAPDEIRIFAFGDSVTMGWGVGDDSHYSAVLERLLNEQPPVPGVRFRVVSAGVNAYPNALVLERLKTVVHDGFQPDVAIIASSFNTGFEGLLELRGEERQQFLRRVHLKSLLARSAFYSFTVEGVLRDVVYYRLRDKLIGGSWETKASAAETASLAAEQYKTRLAAMKAFADGNGVMPVFLLLASNGQKTRLHELQAAMSEFASESALPIVDIVKALQAADHESLYMDHVHPNARGHELIARELLPVIRGLAPAIAGARQKAVADRKAD